MSQQNYKKIWVSLIVVLIILFTIGWTIFDKRFQYELEFSSNQSKKELAFISDIIQKNLQKHDYQSNESFILSWGERTSDIVEIVLTTKNGFKLAHYNSSQTPAHELVENIDITYSYDGIAKLKLRKNIDAIYISHNILLYELMAGYLFISIAFYYLTFTIVRTQKQKQALAYENKQRILAENELASTLKTLQEREQNLAITLNSIGDAVITTDAKGHVNRMNPVAEQLTGWSLHEAKGQALKAVFSIINASTREPIENPVEKVISTGNIVYLSNHTTLISRDGTEYHIADSAAPIRDGGGGGDIQGMVLVFNDVTEEYKLREDRLESEQRFRQLAENIQEVFWLGSPAWDEIFYVSPAYEKIWGQNSEDLYRNPGLWIEAVHPDDREQVINDIPKDINTIGESVDFRKYRIQRSDGQILWIKARAYPIRDHDGRVIRIAGIAENITEQVNMEEALRRTQKMDALGKLTGGIAHDYNNMLGIILGYTDLLKNQLRDQPKLAKYIDTIHHAGERGVNLTRKLLAFSRKNISDAEMLNINALLQDKQLMLEKTLTARIKLIFDLEDDLWPVWLDDGDLEDAVVNLSINAMHAIDENGQLTIQTRNVCLNEADARLFQVKSGDYVQLSINDSGRGMNEITKEKIFEPFFSTKGDNGTGLGLSQVYGFVERSGGAIKVYSEPDHGTRMMLYFPRYHEAGSNDELKEENTALDFSGKENILVVDDEPALLNLTREILESQGYQVICVKNAKQALDALESKPIDLVLSDVIMPEMDGYQLATKVQEKYPGIKIQLVSGFTDDRHINMLDDSLHNNLIYKPYQERDLLKKIRALLDDM